LNRSADALTRKRIEELKAFDPQTVQKRFPPEVTALGNAIDEALSAAFGHGTVEFSRYSSAARLDHGPVVIQLGPEFRGGGQDDGTRQARQYLADGKQQSIVLLQQAISTLEKFEALAGEVGFAVVLLTPDDLAGIVGEPSQASRARQNVIFELGYFVGRLGRGRACLLRKGEVEIPSDLYGVIYSEMDAGEGWKLKLVKELKAANWTLTQIGCGDEPARPLHRPRPRPCCRSYNVSGRTISRLWIIA